MGRGGGWQDIINFPIIAMILLVLEDDLRRKSWLYLASCSCGPKGIVLGGGRRGGVQVKFKALGLDYFAGEPNLDFSGVFYILELH